MLAFKKKLEGMPKAAKKTVWRSKAAVSNRLRYDIDVGTSRGDI